MRTLSSDIFVQALYMKRIVNKRCPIVGNKAKGKEKDVLSISYGGIFFSLTQELFKFMYFDSLLTYWFKDPELVKLHFNVQIYFLIEM